MFSWGELFSTFMARKIMGVKGSCRSPNGGVSLFVCSPYSKGRSFAPAPDSSTGSKRHQNRAKGAKVKIYLLALVFSRENRRPKRAKT